MSQYKVSSPIKLSLRTICNFGTNCMMSFDLETGGHVTISKETDFNTWHNLAKLASTYVTLVEYTRALKIIRKNHKVEVSGVINEDKWRVLVNTLDSEQLAQTFVEEVVSVSKNS